MAPKKKKEEEVGEDAAPQEEEEVEPAEPEILKKYFRVGTQVYYGDCKLGYGARKGTFVRHGWGRQINAAVTPAGHKISSSSMSYETSVMGAYEGNWEDDLMSGQGVYSWSDGSMYDGAFVNGQMHGPGRFIWPDGSTYEGTWHSGQMTGHGRLDYRFDGNFYQGKFQKDAFQRNNGEWVDVWQQTRGIERRAILDHDPQALPFALKRCACGEIYARSPQQRVLADQTQRLAESITAAHNQGYTPFIFADESLQQCVLKCLSTANLTDHTSQSVSLRAAAIAKRRKRDFNGMFYSAIQTSLQKGTLFTLVFEDDDEGCSLLAKEDDRWFERQPSLKPPTNLLPDEWQLKQFFSSNTFPPEVLHPMLFNGRLMSKLFLPEQLREGGIGDGLPAPGGAAPPDDATPDGGAEPGEGAEVPPTSNASPAVAAQAAQAAAAPVPAGGVGLTGHLFELPDVPDPRSAGLRLVHHLRPVIVGSSSLPTGLSDDAVIETVVQRFQNHVPMHRTMLILMTHDSTIAPDTEPTC